MHVDIDAFFASVEQLRNPNLKGKPVIVGTGVIASCSYEARRYGLYAGMPLRQAKRLCPEATILEGHYPTYRCFSDKIFELCRWIAPGVETYLDEAYCDLSGTEGLYGHPLNAARHLKGRIKGETGLSVTVGISTNKMIAKMASSSAKPDGLAIVDEGREQAFVQDVPLEKLPGVGYSTRELLHKLNITTIRQLREMPRESLQALFGANGLALYERCRGRDSRIVSEREVPKSISRETTFHQDTIDLREIEAMLYYLTERAARTMRALGLQSKTVSVHIRYSDSGSQSMTRSLPFPTSLDKVFFDLALNILGRLFTRRVSLRLIGVTLSNFSFQGDRQMELFDEGKKTKLTNLYRCLDELRGRFGHSIILAGRSLDLADKLKRDSYGYILRTPCLTK